VPSSRMRGATPLLPNTPLWRRAQKEKQRDNFNLYLVLTIHYYLPISQK